MFTFDSFCLRILPFRILIQYFHFYISGHRHNQIVKKELAFLLTCLEKNHIFNLAKNLYHQEKKRIDKSSLDKVYCLTSLAHEIISNPDRLKIEIHPIAGNVIYIEKLVDMPVAFTNATVQNVDCSYIVLVFEPNTLQGTARGFNLVLITIQFNPNYSLPPNGISTSSEIY